MDFSRYTSEAKAGLIAALTYVDISPEISIIVAVLSLFDTITGATKAVVLKKFEIKVLVQGFWLKILLLTMSFILAWTAKELGYEGAKYISDTFMILMIAQESFSSFNNIRSAKYKIDYEQLDLLTIFFNFLKKQAVIYLRKNERNIDDK